MLGLPAEQRFSRSFLPLNAGQTVFSFFKQKWTWTVCFFGHSASPESQVLVTNTSEEVLARHVVLAGLPPRQILGIQFEPNLPEEVVQLLHGLRPDPGFSIVVTLAKAASELASNCTELLIV